MRTVALLLAPLLAMAALPLRAHVMSMSSGDLDVRGDRAHYELSMPMYEIAHVKSPETALFEHIRFSSAGQAGRLTNGACHADAAQDAYLCSADYEFAAPVDRLDVECTFHAITVPNHLHLLRVRKGAKRDQAIFDFSFEKAQIRFEPPTRMETAVSETGAGVARALGGPAQILFLAALALAARGRRELALIAGMFLLGQCASALIAPKLGWDPAPRFVEAAAALTIAYLAVEILALPNAGMRWLIAGALGIFHGLFFALFLRATSYSPGYVLAGGAIAELALITVFAWCFSCIGRLATGSRPVQVSAGLLLCVGMFWFFLRMKG